MPLDPSDPLVVGISATALFDLAEADAVYKARYAKNPRNALDEYRAYMLERENEPLRDGTGMPLVRALLGLNRFAPSETKPLVEVVVMSRNSPETGVRVFNIANQFQPREVGFYVPPNPAKMMDPRPNRPQVVQSADCFVDKNGLMYVTDPNAGLNIVQFNGA